MMSLLYMPLSPTSMNSSVLMGSDVEQDPKKETASNHFSVIQESMNLLDKIAASPASIKTGQAGSLSSIPKPFSPQELNLDQSKAEMDLKELSKSVQ